MTEILNNHAEITHINLRKQGPDDNRVLAIDIKFTGAHGGAEILKHLLGINDLDEIMFALWDGKGKPLFPGIESITPKNIIEGCTVALGDMKLENCDARKFHITPRDGHTVGIDFTASVVRPPEAAMRRIPNLISETVPVSITIKQLGLLDQAYPDDGGVISRTSPGKKKRPDKIAADEHSQP